MGNIMKSAGIVVTAGLLFSSAARAQLLEVHQTVYGMD